MGKSNRAHLYTEKEIGALIKRATEIQEKAHESFPQGLSLQEIKDIAREIGIDPKHIRSAASELEHQMATEQRSNFLGAPFLIEQKRAIRGEISAEEWEDLVRQIRRMTGSSGRTTTVGQTRQWHRSVKDMSTTLEETHLQVVSQKNQSIIEIRKHFQGGAYITYLMGLIISGTLAGILLDGNGYTNLVNTGVVLTSMSGGFAAARLAIISWTGRQRRKMHGLMNWIQDQVAGSGVTEDIEKQEIDIPGSEINTDQKDMKRGRRSSV
ncbi:hypothetical protein LQ318_03860 [Aliifodinibius salicampi]|uniref:Uncharacterized protein n=1 Tax=Fodinibius salicampi TaxID=1920655 RepID=A0ABT3PW00_9BACT|nr:hypothetical protein [Fodinibius salicampi]MCW9712032.1 hypothetical protein [Fodinibius salicampi]